MATGASGHGGLGKVIDSGWGLFGGPGEDGADAGDLLRALVLRPESVKKA
ncbi:hypothetical protein [Streptomyces cellulosae]|nr:hypothetical protein [Streptomyces cellulosae]